MPPEPLVLGFDTSAAHCAAALLCGDRLLSEAHEPMEKGQAERLMPLLEEVLAQGGYGWSDLVAIGVGTGPGNFTGIRIAVAAARGLALSLGCPAIGVSRFDAGAFGLPQPVLVSVEARRGGGYGQIVPDGVPFAADEASLPEGLNCIGPFARDWAAVTGGQVFSPALPMAQAIARVAQMRLGTPQPRPAPLYLRAADAAPPSDPPPVILP